MTLDIKIFLLCPIPEDQKPINEYIDFNREYFDKQYMFDYEYIVDFEISEGRLMLKSPYSKYVRLREEDYNKLLEFLKDPEVYKNTKKYNL